MFFFIFDPFKILKATHAMGPSMNRTDDTRAYHNLIPHTDRLFLMAGL